MTVTIFNLFRTTIDLVDIEIKEGNCNNIENINKNVRIMLLILTLTAKT